MAGTKKVMVLLNFFICFTIIFTGCQFKGPDIDTSHINTEASTVNGYEDERNILTITYKDLSAGSANEGFTAEEFDSTPIGEYIQREFGIRFVQLTTSSNENREEMARDIASNQMADVIRWNCNPFDSTLYNIYIMSVLEGQLADLTDAINTFAPSVAEAIKPERLPVYARAVTYPKELENRVYQLPVHYDIGDPWVSGWGFYIRGDLAGKLNIKTPYGWFKDSDEFYNLLVRIQGTSVRDSNGYKIWPGGGAAIWSLISYTNGFDFGGAEEIGIINGKVTGFFQTDWPWKQVKFMRKLINERLLDPEVFTQSQQEYVERLKTGSYGVVPFFVPDQWKGWDTLEALDKPGGTSDWKYQRLGRIANYRGDKFYTANKGIRDVYTLLFSKKAPVERLMKYAEWTLSEEGRRILTFGPDYLGRSVKVPDGYKWTDEYYQKIKSGEWQKTIEYRVSNMVSMFFQLYGADAPETNILFGGPQARNVSTNLNEPKTKNMEFEQKANALEMFQGEFKIINKSTLKMAGQSYSGLNKLEPVLSLHNMYDYDDILKRCYIVETEAEAWELYGNYVQKLMDSGYTEWIKHIQAQYDKDPDSFADYMSPQ